MGKIDKSKLNTSPYIACQLREETVETPLTLYVPTVPDKLPRTKQSRNSPSETFWTQPPKRILLMPALTRTPATKPPSPSPDLCLNCTTAFLAESTTELSPSDPELREEREIPERKSSNKEDLRRKRLMIIKQLRRLKHNWFIDCLC